MPGGVAVYDVVRRSYISTIQIGEPSGPMMPLGKSHAVCFYGHPKIVSLESGEIVKRWEDIDSGKQVSSIIDDLKIPPLALDPERMRFAVAGPTAISVVQIEL